MICSCEKCKYCVICDEGNLCMKRLIFVNKQDSCEDWETDKLFSPTRMVALAIIMIGVMVLLSRVF